MVRIRASGWGFPGRWTTDPFSLPDGTPVTKVGLDCGTNHERVGRWRAMEPHVHDCHCLTILRETVSDLLEELSSYPCEGDIVKLELDLDFVEDLAGLVRM